MTAQVVCMGLMCGVMLGLMAVIVMWCVNQMQSEK